MSGGNERRFIMKKNLFILALITAAGLSLAGCGVGNSNPASVPQNDAANSAVMEVKESESLAQQDSSQSGTNSSITETQAKEIALEDAGVNASDVTGIRVNKDWDDGRAYYDVEFYVVNKEYDYEIDSATGNITDRDFDIENDFGHYAASETDGIISRDKAIEIVLAKVSGASKDDVWIELDNDDGHQVYEGEIRYNRKEYEFELNAEDGSILEWSEEYDD